VNAESQKELDLERYGRLLRSAAGAAFPVAFFAGAGEPVWLAEGSAESGIEIALRELEALEEAKLEAGGARRAEAGQGRCLLYAPVRSDTQQEPGCLAVMLETGLPPERLAALECVLVDVAACIEREYRMNSEADDLAREISTRYEELNLLYSLGGLNESFEFGEDGTKALLRTLVEGLGIDLAAFAVSTQSVPIYVANPSRKIFNLDLVLTAIRGDLFRFTTISRNPLILNSLDDPRRQFLFVNMPYRVLACPVVGPEEMSAMLVLVRLEGRPEFTNGDRNLGMVIANQVAIMLQKHAMVVSLQHFGEQAIGALISAIESKDPYTRGHSEMVQKVAVKIGVAADLDSLTVEDISWGALLHDVGKIGIPENILCKAGSLTDDEYTMMKTHPERTYEILKNIGHLSRGALDAARHHHERFDGTGYPQRLRGKAIPLESRVIAVADTYEAMTSSRSYRAGKDHGAAMDEIREVAGTQLDPDLVHVFDDFCEREESWLETLRQGDEIGDG
jgi:HD-GYP domain-containing protein (c-di-GMP phosphodiesterase class II)